MTRHVGLPPIPVSTLQRGRLEREKKRTEALLAAQAIEKKEQERRPRANVFERGAASVFGAVAGATVVPVAKTTFNLLDGPAKSLGGLFMKLTDQIRRVPGVDPAVKFTAKAAGETIDQIIGVLDVAAETGFEIGAFLPRRASELLRGGQPQERREAIRQAIQNKANESFVGGHIFGTLLSLRDSPEVVRESARKVLTGDASLFDAYGLVKEAHRNRSTIEQLILGISADPTAAIPIGLVVRGAKGATLGAKAAAVTRATPAQARRIITEAARRGSLAGQRGQVGFTADEARQIAINANKVSPQVFVQRTEDTIHSLLNTLSGAGEEGVPLLKIGKRNISKLESKRDALVFELLRQTGARPGEIWRLQWGDLRRIADGTISPDRLVGRSTSGQPISRSIGLTDLPRAQRFVQEFVKEKRAVTVGRIADSSNPAGRPILNSNHHAAAPLADSHKLSAIRGHRRLRVGWRAFGCGRQTGKELAAGYYPHRRR
ncbi:MAG: site-specific integrase [Chloroflexi bacterium]|nr:site-specific integrase [Chloroflexota bacterium]